MRRILQFLERLDMGLENALYAVAMTVFGLFVVLIVYQVASRNIAFLPVIQWTEEVSRFSFMWMIILGALNGVLRSDHFLIDIFDEHPRARHFTRWLRELLILLVGFIFVSEGLGFGLSGARRISMAASLPMSYVYISFFVMGIITTLFSIHRILILVVGSVPALDTFDKANPIISAVTSDAPESSGLTGAAPEIKGQ